MPKRLLSYSRTEPAKTILLIIAVITLLVQVFTMTPWFGPPEVLRLGLSAAASSFWTKLPNVMIISSLSFWSMFSVRNKDVKNMARSSFWLAMTWLWSGLARLFLAPFPGQLLWVPFIIIAFTLGVVYIYLSHEKKRGTGHDA